MEGSPGPDSQLIDITNQILNTRPMLFRIDDKREIQFVLTLETLPAEVIFRYIDRTYLAKSLLVGDVQVPSDPPFPRKLAIGLDLSHAESLHRALELFLRAHAEDLGPEE